MNNITQSKTVEGRNPHRLSLREARENLLLSVSEASKLSGLAESTIRRAERDSSGMPFLKFLKLCKAYRVSVDHVYVGVELDLLKIREDFYTTKNRPNAFTLASAR